MKSNFGDKVSFATFTQPDAAEASDEEGPSKPESGDFDFDFLPRDIKSVVEEYVNAAHDAGLREVRLIHGRGKGVQRGIVQQALERHPLVSDFWDAPESHLGATVARLDGQILQP